MANTTRETEAIGDDQITDRYGVDTPMSPDGSDDSVPGTFLSGSSSLSVLPFCTSVSCYILLLLCVCFVSELEGSVPFVLLVSPTSGDSDYMSEGVTPTDGSSGSEASTGPSFPYS